MLGIVVQYLIDTFYSFNFKVLKVDRAKLSENRRFFKRFRVALPPISFISQLFIFLTWFNIFIFYSFLLLACTGK